MEEKEKKAIHKILGAEMVSNLFKFFSEKKVKFDAVPGVPDPNNPPATPANPELKELESADGKKFAVNGELAVDAVIMDVSGAEPVPVEGEVVLKDGTKIKATAGKITEIEKVEVAAPLDMAAATEQLTAQFKAEKVEFEKAFNIKYAAQEKRITEQEATIKDHNVMLSKVTDFMVKMMETAVEEKQPTGSTALAFERQATKEEYAKFNNFQKLKHNELFKKP